LVAPRVAPVHRLAGSATSTSGDSDADGGRRERKDFSSLLALSRSQAIRKFHETRGISSDAIDLSFNRYKGGETEGTNRKHDSAWKDYQAWFQGRSGSVYDFNIADITDYVAGHLFTKLGKSAAVCMAFLSTASVTAREFGIPNLQENAMIVNLREGMKKKRPPKDNKSQQYWSVYALFQLLKTWSSNDDTCPVRILREKLIVLLLLDSMARSSDIASICRDTVRLQGDNVFFHFYYSKTAKVPSEFPAAIGAFPDDPLISTPVVMLKYIQRTAEYKTQPIQHWVDGKTVDRHPLLLYDYKDQNGFYPPLKKERIAKIANLALQSIGATGWGTHSTRGATSSKCYNLRAPLDWIILRARWANEQTFLKSYFKKCIYTNVPRNVQDMTLEQLLRFEARRAPF
jgi:hypothetical protein